MRWREVRDELFRSHPQSPLPEPAGLRAGSRYFPYDPALRFARGGRCRARARDADRQSAGTSRSAFDALREARFALGGAEHALELFWLDGYGGGLFVPFRDATSGAETYGGGRYLLDTVKGADLGHEGGRLVLDFNFAYNPSCATTRAGSARSRRPRTGCRSRFGRASGHARAAH